MSIAESHLLTMGLVIGAIVFTVFYIGVLEYFENKKKIQIEAEEDEKYSNMVMICKNKKCKTSFFRLYQVRKESLSWLKDWSVEELEERLFCPSCYESEASFVKSYEWMEYDKEIPALTHKELLSSRSVAAKVEEVISGQLNKLEAKLTTVEGVEAKMFHLASSTPDYSFADEKRFRKEIEDTKAYISGRLVDFTANSLSEELRKRISVIDERLKRTGVNKFLVKPGEEKGTGCNEDTCLHLSLNEIKQVQQRYQSFSNSKPVLSFASEQERPGHFLK